MGQPFTTRFIGFPVSQAATTFKFTPKPSFGFCELSHKLRERRNIRVFPTLQCNCTLGDRILKVGVESVPENINILTVPDNSIPISITESQPKLVIIDTSKGGSSPYRSRGLNAERDNSMVTAAKVRLNSNVINKLNVVNKNQVENII